MNRVEHAEFACRDHCFTAAPTAIADEIDALSYIFAELNQVLLVCLLKQIHSFVYVHRSGVTVSGQGLSRAVEGHTNIHGCVAILPDMHHFMSAIANANPTMGGSLDHFTGSFVIQNVKCIFIGEDWLVHKNAAKLGFSSHKQVADEVFFYIQVLVKQLTQHFLVDVTAQTHH